MDLTVTLTDIASGVSVEMSVDRAYVDQAPAPFWPGLMGRLQSDLDAQLGG